MGFSETFGVEKGSGTRVVEWLNSEALAKKYAVTAQNKTVTVSSISGEQMKSTETKSTDLGLFSCTHCGYVTRFETDLNAHRMIHYL